ncbi:hypothetical protein ACRB68_02800 [Actinomadura sp. RB68]|uniref:DOD-type homing endonuclease domain-containing protein n=2 Tax=Actinomadura macrotermitis TaxID=2585200 RepID=A0A7K0BM41_9ACTN|nr:hypothetical protein [Actinomadura macrotermitis]
MPPDSRKELARKLKQNGLTDQEIALACGVSSHSIRLWRDADKRAAAPPALLTKDECSRCRTVDVDRQAYAYLLGVYLGDGCLTHKGRDVYRLELACSDAWPGLVDEAAEAVAAVMPDSKVGRYQKSGCKSVGSHSKHWPCLFPQHGPGHKHTRKIELASWQDEIVANFSQEFIRGLIHSDGCRAMNKVRRQFKSGERLYEYPRYFFTNASDDIRMLFTDALDRLGIEWKQNNARNISVAKREAVARLDGFVGPKF